MYEFDCAQESSNKSLMTNSKYIHFQPGSHISQQNKIYILLPERTKQILKYDGGHTWRALTPILLRYAAKILVDKHSPKETK